MKVLNIKIPVIVLIFCITFSLNLNAKRSDYVGTSTSKLMLIEVDTRVNSLGGAYCGYVSDIVGYEENIAGISELNEYQLVLAYYDWFVDTSIQYIAFGMPVTKKGVAVTSFKYLNVPPFANKNDWGEDSGSIDINNYIFSLGFGWKYKYYLKYGINLKYNHQGYYLNSDNLLSTSSLGLDLGVQYKWDVLKIPFFKKKKLNIYNFQTGFTFQNIGYNTSNDSLPRRIKLGISYPFIESCVFLFDINKDVYTFGSLIDSDYRFNFGIEYNYKKMLFIRGGAKFGYEENNFTIGAGFQTQFGSFLTMFNYTLGSHKEFGYMNNGSISSRFEKISLRKPLHTSKRKLVNYHYYRGLSLFVQDEIEQAIKEWEEVLKIDPYYSDAEKRIEEAEEILKKREELK